MEDYIEKRTEIAAPVGRVWRALTDFRQFSEWFRVSLEGPFVAGQSVGGQLTFPGYEHIRMEVEVKSIEPETYFSYAWHPYGVDPKVDYTQETPTLVEFRLKPAGGGTLLTVKESGFDKIPSARRAEAFRMNTGGWEQQLKNIETYVRKTS
ncbi:MAG: SRPBCC family protein [Candidatus Acidiferrales bacterium]